MVYSTFLDMDLKRILALISHSMCSYLKVTRDNNDVKQFNLDMRGLDIIPEVKIALYNFDKYLACTFFEKQ